MALGVALSIKANLGISPISSVTYVYSLGFPYTMGVITIVMHVAFILLQIVLLRKEYQLIQLLQLPVAIIFGLFTDLTLSLVSSKILVSNYIFRWILCLLSCLVIAFGMYLQVKARVIYLAGEGLVIAICKTFHKEFGKVKVVFDCTLVSIGIISSFLWLHNLQGIREGTIASALLVGVFVSFYNKKLKFVDAILGVKVEKKIADQTIAVASLKNVVITVVAPEKV